MIGAKPSKAQAEILCGITNTGLEDTKKRAVMKVKCDENIFNKWHELGDRIKLLSGIVQNDMEITKDDLKDWKQTVLKTRAELDALAMLTLRYIRRCQDGSV